MEQNGTVEGHDLEELEPQAPLIVPKRNSKAKYKDYDALTEEKEAFGVIVGGKEIEFPKVLPAKLMLDLQRKRQRGELDDEGEVFDFGFEIIERVIGRENWEYILEHTSVQNAGAIVGDMLEYHGLTGGDEDEEEGPTEPATTPAESPLTESSSISDSWTPTSSGTGPEPGNGSGAGSSDGRPSSSDSEPSQTSPSS